MYEPMKGEIKRAERLARVLTGKKDCKVGGYYTQGETLPDVVTFECEVLTNNCSDFAITIYIEAFIPDRRRSWVHV